MENDKKFLEQMAQSNANVATSYQAQLTSAKGKLADIESANDPSAKSIKKGALILCKQLEDFYQDYQTNELNYSVQIQYQERQETLKLGNAPTNLIEKTRWSEQRDKIFWEYSRKRTEFDVKWSSKFTTDFYGRVATMRDHMAILGYVDEALNKQLEKPFFANVYWSQQMAMEFCHLANQIKE